MYSIAYSLSVVLIPSFQNLNQGIFGIVNYLQVRYVNQPLLKMFISLYFAEERKLADKERPLFVQLNWGKDDREGRFLLKNEDFNKNVPVSQQWFHFLVLIF